ncbi:FK506-binding protein 15 isoform X2 [Microcaecilia unicolor]|uniref:peptidylprolyl isomerase n=1 Tax=Microcaecilia unicolor TaxID=1415580 RepID=A0A6P7YHM6_9AMPH|nr:FK506-binding protein 15 isoform X2 [Microcaecilia unicolor]
MFWNEEEDVDFLSPTGGTKLASLFGLDQTMSGQENESFQYTAPKQPKKGQSVAADKKTSNVAAVGAPQVLFATAVHAYRFVKGQYVKQGKFGVAVLANHTTKEYWILLYVSQQQPVTTARIHPEFIFTVQPNNYSNFYDDQRENWSVMFESEKAACDFNKQICIAKWNCRSSQDSVLYQELVLGEGQAVEVGDLIEVAYTGWLFQNHELGQVFDSSINKDKFLRLKLGSGKVIKGWEEGMVGLKKGGKRLVIISPALAYGCQGVAKCVPPNSTLVFEVEVKRVKLKDSGSDRQSIDSRDLAAQFPVSSTDGFSTEFPILPPIHGEPAVRAKSNSISEQLTNPDVAKAKLISRMAKMGQPMLPFLAGTPALHPDSSGSELEDLRDSAHSVVPLPVRHTPQLSHVIPPQLASQVPEHKVSGLESASAALLPIATVQTQPTGPGETQSFQPYTGVAYTYPSGPTPSSQLQATGQMYSALISQPPHFQASGDVTSFLMTEARQHNTEIRMVFNKVADKIDQLAYKVGEIQKQNAGDSLLPRLSSVTMETAMIMNNIQRIIQENERLKQEVFEKSSRIEEQNEKISALIQRNQRYVEQSNLLMEQRNDSLKSTTENTQARVLHVEQEKAKVAEELTTATGQISRLQLELTAHQKEEMELQSQLTTAQQETEKHRQQLNLLQAQLTELQETSEHVQSNLKAEKQSCKQLEVKITSLEEEVVDLMAEKKSLEKNLAEWKKKSQLERQQAAEEMEEIHMSYQAELERLRQAFIKARTSTDQAAEQVKKIMNNVFQHLRGEFKLEGVYSGRALLNVVMNTIKTVTLQLLHRQADQEKQESSSEEEETTLGKMMGKSAEGVQEEIPPKLDEKLQAIVNNIQAQNSEHQVETKDLKLSSTASTKEVNLSKAQEEEPFKQRSSKVQEEEPVTIKTVLPISQETPEPFTQLLAADVGCMVLGRTVMEEALPLMLSEHSEVPTGNRTIQNEGNLEPIVEVAIEEGSISETTARVAEALMGISKEEDQEGRKAKELEKQGPTSPLRNKEDVDSCDKAGEPVSLRDKSVLVVTTLDMTEVNVNKDWSSSELNNSIPSVYEDESDNEGLFKMASPKLLKLDASSREEEEEDVSMKGRPPSAPLFGDDDDDDDNDDLDWLG